MSEVLEEFGLGVVEPAVTGSTVEAVIKYAMENYYRRGAEKFSLFWSPSGKLAHGPVNEWVLPPYGLCRCRNLGKHVIFEARRHARDRNTKYSLVAWRGGQIISRFTFRVAAGKAAVCG